MAKNLSALAKPVDHDDALITSVVPYGDSDLIVRLFLRTRGRMVAFCRRGRSNRKGTCTPQAPALAHVGIIHGDQKLARLVSCDLDVTSVFMCSPKIFALRAYLSEIIEKMVPEEDVAEDIFDLVTDAFIALRNDESSAHILRAFELKLLDHAGYLPEMPDDDEEEDVVAFDPHSSRFVHDDYDGTLAFSPTAIKLAKAMLIAKIGAVNYGEDGELLMLGRIFQSRLKVMGLFPLKSVAFLKQLSLRERNGG